jgi:alpha-glucosidase
VSHFRCSEKNVSSAFVFNWTNEVIKGKEIWVDTKFDEIPILCEEHHSNINPVQQYVGELQFEELTLDVYYKEGKENLWLKMHKMDMITKKGRYSFLSFKRQVKKRN